MARAGRYLAAAVGIALFAFFGGFVIFASSIAHYAPVVGLQRRRHRRAHRRHHRAERGSPAAWRRVAASRLLISGVNRMTTREDLYRKSGLTPALFACCVDIGYDAHDTSGNAEETKAVGDATAVHAS